MNQLYKLVMSSELAPDGLEGDKLPPNFKEITEKEFAQSIFFTYTPLSYEWRRLREAIPEFDLKPWSEFKLFWIPDGRGFAINQDYQSGKIRYFKFCLCDHEDVSKRSLGRCLTEYECKKCKRLKVIDSSD